MANIEIDPRKVPFWGDPDRKLKLEVLAHLLKELDTGSKKFMRGGEKACDYLHTDSKGKNIRDHVIFTHAILCRKRKKKAGSRYEVLVPSLQQQGSHGNFYESLGVLINDDIGIKFKRKPRAIKRRRIIPLEKLKIQEENNTIMAEWNTECKLFSEGSTIRVKPSVIYKTRSGEVEAFIISELGNCDLRELITSKTKLPIKIKFDIIGKILAALAELRKQGIIHRDIKPENIIICFDTSSDVNSLFSYTIHFIDFDSSVYERDAINFNNGKEDPRFLTGGAFFYLSREQLSNILGQNHIYDVGFGSDLPATAVVIGEMLGGTIIYDIALCGTIEYALVNAIKSESPNNTQITWQTFNRAVNRKFENILPQTQMNNYNNLNALTLKQDVIEFLDRLHVDKNRPHIDAVTQQYQAILKKHNLELTVAEYLTWRINYIYQKDSNNKQHTAHLKLLKYETFISANAMAIRKIIHDADTAEETKGEIDKLSTAMKNCFNEADNPDGNSAKILQLIDNCKSRVISILRTALKDVSLPKELWDQLLEKMAIGYLENIFTDKDSKLPFECKQWLKATDLFNRKENDNVGLSDLRIKAKLLAILKENDLLPEGNSALAWGNYQKLLEHNKKYRADSNNTESQQLIDPIIKKRLCLVGKSGLLNPDNFDVLISNKWKPIMSLAVQIAAQPCTDTFKKKDKDDIINCLRSGFTTWWADTIGKRKCTDSFSLPDLEKLIKDNNCSTNHLRNIGNAANAWLNATDRFGTRFRSQKMRGPLKWLRELTQEWLCCAGIQEIEKKGQQDTLLKQYNDIVSNTKKLIEQTWKLWQTNDNYKILAPIINTKNNYIRHIWLILCNETTTSYEKVLKVQRYSVIYANKHQISTFHVVPTTASLIRALFKSCKVTPVDPAQGKDAVKGLDHINTSLQTMLNEPLKKKRKKILKKAVKEARPVKLLFGCSVR